MLDLDRLILFRKVGDGERPPVEGTLGAQMYCTLIQLQQ